MRQLGWKKPYHVDADHISLKTVDRFIDASDFFTIDVAEAIGQPASPRISSLCRRHPEPAGHHPGHRSAIHITREAVAASRKVPRRRAGASAIYRHIAAAKGAGAFITEVSMDETDAPQTPVELLIILAAIADEKIPIQTIAPKFTGRFNKGVDYVGDVKQFAKEFDEDLAAIAFAVKQYGLPENLKLSVHSGSDKFSIYEAIHGAMVKFDAGVHLKTAGTTWLGGADRAGGGRWAGLELAKEIYREAYAHADELSAPYATVIDIDQAKLPKPEEVERWTSEQYTSALRHDQKNPAYNPSFRQLLHVGFKVAAKMGDKYLKALEASEANVSRNVTEQSFERHIKPLFLAE